MAFWKLNAEQETILTCYTEHRDVLDVMSGDCELSYLIAHNGAKSVTAVDSSISNEYQESPIVNMVQCQLIEYVDSGLPIPKTVVISWPPNYGVYGLLELLNSAEVVVYIGKCVDGTVCGTDAMWKMLVGREIMDHSPDKRNTVTVYGPKTVERPLTGEEIAAIANIHYADSKSVPLSFEDAEKKASEGSIK